MAEKDHIPQTNAGRAMLASAWMLGAGEPPMADTIRAIEREAASQERARIADLVRRLWDDETDEFDDRSVLALLQTDG